MAKELVYLGMTILGVLAAYWMAVLFIEQLGD